jgi:cytochrome b561
MPISKDRYSLTAIALHWLIAVLLIGNIGIAWYFDDLRGAAKIPPLELHRSIGITILLLSLGRLALRLASPPPPLPASLTGWERALSKAVHVLFYVAMIGLPLTGWAMVSVGPRLLQTPMTLFHTIPWPAIGPLTTVPAAQVHSTHDFFVGAHGILGKMAYGLIVLHVAGALKHQFIDRDDVVARMAPWLKRRAAAPAR